MTGQRTLKERETEKQRGKKRYIERLVEEQEAKQELERFKHEPSNYPEREDDTNRPS